MSKERTKTYRERMRSDRKIFGDESWSYPFDENERIKNEIKHPYTNAIKLRLGELTNRVINYFR